MGVVSVVRGGALPPMCRVIGHRPLYGSAIKHLSYYQLVHLILGNQTMPCCHVQNATMELATLFPPTHLIMQYSVC